MNELNSLEPVIKNLLLRCPDKANFLLVIDTNMALLAQTGDEEGVKILCQFKRLYLDKKLANPSSIVRVARKLREKAREGKESSQLLPSAERSKIIAQEEINFKTYSLKETRVREINDQMEW